MRYSRTKSAVIAATPSTSNRDRLVNTLFAATVAVLTLPPLYLAKSALGIDLLPGPSPLHDLLYWLVR